jgi:hypothetical protein
MFESVATKVKRYQHICKEATEAKASIEHLNSILSEYPFFQKEDM